MKFPSSGYAHYLPFGWPWPIYGMRYDRARLRDDRGGKFTLTIHTSKPYELAPWAPTFEMVLDGDCDDQPDFELARDEEWRP